MLPTIEAKVESNSDQHTEAIYHNCKIVGCLRSGGEGGDPSQTSSFLDAFRHTDC